MDALPEMVLTEVLLLLPIEDVLNLALVCRSLKAPARSSHTWVRLMQRDFGTTENMQKLDGGENPNCRMLSADQRLYFVGIQNHKLEWESQDSLISMIVISEDRKTAQFREGSGHTDLCATKSFSKGLHRWRIKIDGGLDSMGYWIGIGCTIDRSKSFNYSDSIHFGFSSVGNKLGNFTGMPRTKDRWKEGDIITVLLDCRKKVLTLYQNDTAMESIRLPQGNVTFWPWVNLYNGTEIVTFVDY